MINTLLSENKFFKLCILYRFYQKSNELHTISDIQDNLGVYLGVTAKTTLRYIHELNEEIDHLTGLDSFIYKTATHTYQINPAFLEKSCMVFNTIRYCYFKESIPFQACLQLVIEGDLSINDLCDSLAVSRSYAYKVIRNLNKSLKKFDIAITQGNDKKLTFEGNEVNIRLYVYNFFISCVPNSIWLFPVEKETIQRQVQKIAANRKLSEYSLNNLLILFGILHCRLSNGFLLNNQEFEVLRNYFELSRLDSFDCTDYFSTYCNDQLKIANEELAFSFFVQIFLNDIVSIDKIYQIADRIIAEDSTIYQFIGQFISDYSADLKISLTQQQYRQIIYYYYLFFTFSISATRVYLLDIWNLNTLDFEQLPYVNEPVQLLEADDKKQKEIEQIYTKLINDPRFTSIRELLLDNSNVKYFISLTYIQLSILDTSQVSIYLHFIKNYITKKFLKEKLQLIYQNGLLNFVDDYENADIIITDNPEYLNGDYRIVLVNNIFDPVQFLHIMNAVNNEILTILK
ncbi:MULTISPECIES: helix-turn-helix domain-containing protein [Enterococcus]|uniref:Mga helix-turn-helix domain-containing protein n=1 Tax=Candidatus Enterococcus ferrettii TaxID=2815324 RepID=A0ABV0EU30_9ENTE|nr:helix-turn-helix domain-containing protein [Enterococcus sp. 665A]MBO1341030.1 helix-turn-helix domain-containing protein [Enterococcus sp. 665A]